MIKHYIWLSPKARQGDFLMAVAGNLDPINLGDYIEGRFLGDVTSRKTPNGTMMLFAFEVVFSSDHNENNTLVTWFAALSANVTKILVPFAASREPVVITPRHMRSAAGHEWYWPEIKELVCE